MKTISKTGLKVKAAIKAGGLGGNHNRGLLKVKTALKAGYRFVENHSRRPLSA